MQVQEHSDKTREYLNTAFNFATAMLFSFLPTKSAQISNPIVGTFYAGTVFIPAIMRIAEEAQEASVKEKVLPLRMLDLDLDILAKGARVLFKNATDELFGTGRMLSAKLSMADIIGDGSYYDLRDTEHEKIQEGFERHMTREIALTAYKRQGFKLFWALVTL